MRTLRDLGLDLDTVQRIIAGQSDLADVARAHLSALDAEIRMLRLRRTVLRSVAERRYDAERLGMVRDLARLSVEQRQHIIEDFVARTFAGIEGGDGVAAAMWRLPIDLPDDPTPEQVDAWVELAELVNDDDFRSRQPAAGSRHVGEAIAAGVAPYSEEGRAVLDRVVGPDLPVAHRRRLADEIAVFTDRRVERYWHLIAVLGGWPPSASAAPAFEWLIAALHATVTP
ncbi:MerR family transcriptional regulator [Nonomuraea sp. TT08I-71]|nr:MerR family transcriptional regulator [Nonomuraea sp. TT08I-71]